MQTGMKIGHDENVIKETRETIMQIICAPTGDTVKEAALKALTKTLAISGMTVSNVSIRHYVASAPNRLRPSPHRVASASETVTRCNAAPIGSEWI